MSALIHPPLAGPASASSSAHAPAGIDLAALAQTGLAVVQDDVIVYANQALARLLGWPLAELPGQHYADHLVPEVRARAREVMRRCQAGRLTRPGQTVCLRRDGSRFDGQHHASRILHAGRPAVLVDLLDISAATAALQRAEWNATMLARTEALCRTGSLELDCDSGVITPSSGLLGLLGLDGDATAGAPPMHIDTLDWVPEDERAYVTVIWRNAEPDEPFEFQHRVQHHDGHRLVVLHRGVLSRKQPHGAMRLVAMLQDITAQREAEQRIDELSSHDEVSGLPNRAALLDQIDSAMHAARWTEGGMTLLAIDVPRIAEIKSGMGFGAGDTLAMALAARLKAACTEGEMVARVGETEFALVIHHGTADAPADADARALALMHQMQASVHLGSTDVFSQCQIGVAAFPADADSPGGLLEAAQAARLDIRASSGIARYRREVSARVWRQMHVESALRRALAGNELSLHYQPQVDLATGDIRGAEALLRWNSAELGAVMPDEFIPIAERSGLIGAIGDWVLQRACEQAVAWQRAGLAALRVSVNLSPAQLQRPDLAAHVQAVLHQTGARGEQMGVELTEGMLMTDVDGAAAVLRAIKALGVEISLDDFGTGYSSLNSLSRLPIDVVKIDRSLVHDVTAATQQVSVTRAIINMAHGLQMHVLAEGVETEGQLSLLASHGCDQIQGYWFSRPVTPEAFEAMLRAGRRLPEKFIRRAPRQRTLLLVDDEDNIVAALKRLLRREGYLIVTASSAAEGLQRLTEHEVDVIVSDQRMPGMTGVEFLHRAKELYPGTVRMVLSGYTELQSIIDAVNEGAIYKFLTKPWDDQRLRAHIAEAFRQKELADENRHLARQVETANTDLATLNERLERLLSQQREHTELLAAGADGLRDLLDDLPLPLLGVDPEGFVAYANRGAERLLCSSGSPLGQALTDTLPAHELRGEDGSAALLIAGEHFRLMTQALGDAQHSRGQLVLLLPGERAGRAASPAAAPPSTSHRPS
ncbi:MAG: hypothetical protein RLZZ584_937 [Pseudomonadota bacterium]|jgi:diguanylate cyclase (GGDEF)-like protein/PAS domain S-box-containing protein